MISLPAGSRIWLVAGITDMRNGEGSFLDPRQPFFGSAEERRRIVARKSKKSAHCCGE